jgi:plasmid maintenance system antidote protein VapI
MSITGDQVQILERERLYDAEENLTAAIAILGQAIGCRLERLPWGEDLDTEFAAYREARATYDTALEAAVAAAKGLPAVNMPGHRLDEMLRVSGLSVTTLAARVGVPIETVLDWLRGDSEIPEDAQETLADFFGVSIRWLMEVAEVEEEENKRMRDLLDRNRKAS